MPDSDPSEHPRVTLPKNLSETLKRLADAELECSCMRSPRRLSGVA